MGEPAVQIVKGEDVTEIIIGTAMTIETVAHLKAKLLEALVHGQAVHISLAEVTEVDVTGLQLLCSAHRTSLSRGAGFSVSGSAGAFSSTADMAGMMRHIGCAIDVCGTCVWKKGGSHGVAQVSG